MKSIKNSAEMIIMHSHDLILLRFEKFVIYPNTLVKCQNVDLSL